jgi:SAM-dependent methyltransferase
MTSSFKDNFSKQSDLYVKYRPHYPESLYEYLQTLTSEHTLVWDCGTGNGQAALGIANYYDKVIATDPSETQIKNAFACRNVIYSVSPAEYSGLENNSVDLITIANALHWFDFELFNKEATRVLKPQGVIAAWGYGNPSHAPELDKIITYFHDEVIGPYWLPENRLVEKNYSTVPFPFAEIRTPAFKIEKSLSFNDLIGLFGTWSAVQRYKDKTGKDPVIQIEEELKKAWKDLSGEKIFTWRLVLKVGRK